MAASPMNYGKSYFVILGKASKAVEISHVAMICWQILRGYRYYCTTSTSSGIQGLVLKKKRVPPFLAVVNPIVVDRVVVYRV